jgi:hypothetical protein
MTSESGPFSADPDSDPDQYNAGRLAEDELAEDARDVCDWARCIGGVWPTGDESLSSSSLAVSFPF